MPELKKTDLAFAKVVSQLIDSNPFLPQRTELERKALGKKFVESGANWTLDPSEFSTSENGDMIEEQAELARERMFYALKSGAKASALQCELYQDVCYYVLFCRFRKHFERLRSGAAKNARKIYAEFHQQFRELFELPVLPESTVAEAPHMFALLYQLFRAFNNLFENLIGGSEPIIRLRACVWQSIFTCDIRRYRSFLFQRMADFSTLTTGPSGSGKELVARAIGLSCYIPFDEETNTFGHDIGQMFHTLNLSAMNPSLIESELFGHRKGAFTGADRDRTGWLESCPEYGTVFLDEIGELDEVVQVKLLRVLQEREFQPVGDSRVLPFRGRIIAATNRNIGKAVAEGRLRQDFVYRICSDHIQMPSLAERSRGAVGELSHLVRHLLNRIVGTDDPKLAATIVDWIKDNLGKDYAWPGNVRELEQCIRSYLVRQDYRPFAAPNSDTPLLTALESCRMTADELLTAFCTVSYSISGNYLATARQLNIDRRTVKAHVDEKLLDTLGRGPRSG